MGENVSLNKTLLRFSIFTENGLAKVPPDVVKHL